MILLTGFTLAEENGKKEEETVKFWLRSKLIAIEVRFLLTCTRYSVELIVIRRT